MDGTVAIGEADLTIVSLPMMAHREDGESVFRVLMADVGHWVSVRKGPRPALLVVDEFSAVSGARGEQRPCATAPAVRGHQSGARPAPFASRAFGPSGTASGRS
jgi:hypothetical protein